MYEHTYVYVCVHTHSWIKYICIKAKDLCIIFNFLFKNLLNCICIQSRNVKKTDHFAKYTWIYKVIENETKISIEMLYACLIDI